MKNDFNIGFSSLKDGKHHFSYKLERSFFEHFEYSEIKNGTLEVEFILDKKPTLMNTIFKISGNVEVMCDRCTDDFMRNIKTSHELVYKFGTEEMNDENVIVVFPNEFKIDISKPIYEFITTALPSKRLHKPGECNEEMLKIMDNYLLISEEEEE